MERKGKPSSVQQLERLLAIDGALRSPGSSPSSARLSEDLGVSGRTIYRDIAFLRDRLGAPVVYDAKRRCYRYSEPSYFLPQLALSEAEALALLAAVEMMAGYAGDPMASRLRAAVDRLVRGVPRPTRKSLLKAVRQHYRFEALDGEQCNCHRPELFEILERAVAEGKVVRLRCVLDGEVTERLFEPEVLRHGPAGWTLVGRCRQDGPMEISLGVVDCCVPTLPRGSP